MSAPKRRHAPDLIDQLLTQPHRFGFFQAVRLFETWLKTEPAGVSGNARLPPELVFRNSISLSFPASEIESLAVFRRDIQEASGEGDDGQDKLRAAIERIEITPAFMSMLGVMGSLPLVYTEQIAQRELQHKDAAARSFLDLFSHRAVSLFYAAWKRSRLHLQYESDRRHRFTPMVLSLAGLGQDALRDRLAPLGGGVQDESVAFFAGALQQRVLSAQQLQQVLSRYFRVEVRIEQFCGRWYSLPVRAQTSLGDLNGVLGRNALSGERVWQRDLRVRVVLGPLTHDAFLRFLPGASGAKALRELLTLLSGVSLEYEIKLVLRADAVKGSVLASSRSPLAGRLGWDTYVQTGTQSVDRSDVCYDIV